MSQSHLAHFVVVPQLFVSTWIAGLASTSVTLSVSCNWHRTRSLQNTRTCTSTCLAHLWCHNPSSATTTHLFFGRAVVLPVGPWTEYPWVASKTPTCHRTLSSFHFTTTLSVLSHLHSSHRSGSSASRRVAAIISLPAAFALGHHAPALKLVRSVMPFKLGREGTESSPRG